MRDTIPHEIPTSSGPIYEVAPTAETVEGVARLWGWSLANPDTTVAAHIRIREGDATGLIVASVFIPTESSSESACLPGGVLVRGGAVFVELVAAGTTPVEGSIFLT